MTASGRWLFTMQHGVCRRIRTLRNKRKTSRDKAGTSRVNELFPRLVPRTRRGLGRGLGRSGRPAASGRPRTAPHDGDNASARAPRHRCRALHDIGCVRSERVARRTYGSTWSPTAATNPRQRTFHERSTHDSINVRPTSSPPRPARRRPVRPHTDAGRCGPTPNAKPAESIARGTTARRASRPREKK